MTCFSSVRVTIFEPLILGVLVAWATAEYLDILVEWALKYLAIIGHSDHMDAVLIFLIRVYINESVLLVQQL